MVRQISEQRRPGRVYLFDLAELYAEFISLMNHANPDFDGEDRSGRLHALSIGEFRTEYFATFPGGGLPPT